MKGLERNIMFDPITLALLFGGSALAGGLGSAFSKPGGFQKMSLLDPSQLAGQRSALQMALSGLQNPTQGFEPIAQNAMQQFQSNIIPSIAERFTALGGQRSSGFQNALQQGAVGLSSNLAAQKAQFGLQNQGQLMNLLGMGLKPNFEYAYQQPEPGFLGGALGGLSQGLGSLGTAGLGQYLGIGGSGGFNPGSLSSAPQRMQYLQGLRSQWGI